MTYQLTEQGVTLADLVRIAESMHSWPARYLSTEQNGRDQGASHLKPICCNKRLAALGCRW